MPPKISVLLASMRENNGIYNVSEDGNTAWCLPFRERTRRETTVRLTPVFSKYFWKNHTLTDKHCQSVEGKKGLGPKGGKKPCIETGPYKKLLTSHGFKASKTTKKTTESVKPTPQQRLSFDKPVAKDHPTIITEYSSDYSYK